MLYFAFAQFNLGIGINIYYVICIYAKGGGSYAQSYARGEKCSDCMAPWDNCNDGLCTRNDGSSLFSSKTSSVIIFAIVVFIFML